MATEWLDGETNTVYTRSKSQERNLQDQEDSPTLFALIFHFAMFLSAPKNFASNNWHICISVEIGRKNGPKVLAHL